MQSTQNKSSNSFNNGIPLFLTSCIEKSTVACDAVHNLQAMLQLNAISNPDSKTEVKPSVFNFVVVIDVSSSMRQHNKLSHVQATIEYMLAQLESRHNFCLIQFNESASMLTEGLISLSDENKKTILENVRSMRPSGSTNISDALLLSLESLKSHCQNPSSGTSLSSILLFTDGLANMGIRGNQLINELKSWQEQFLQPQAASTITIHTFGFGCDHDSSLLQRISLSAGAGCGVYYYIQNTDHIATTFAQCMAGMLNTVAYDIKISLSACDGCRFVRFCTPFKINEIQQNKLYTVDMGSMYREESRTLLFKLSLRNMKTELQHTLANVTVTFTNISTGEQNHLATSFIVNRPKSSSIPPSPSSVNKLSHSSSMPLDLDIQVNRFNAAQCMMDVIPKSSQDQFQEACTQLLSCVSSIECSISGSQEYCNDLIMDLTYCLDCVKDSYTFNAMGGKHVAVSLATMYLLERSTGISHLFRDSAFPPSIAGSNPNNDAADRHHDYLVSAPPKQRRVGYGYLTAYQEEECVKAKNESEKIVARYLNMYDNDSGSSQATPLPSKPAMTVYSLMNEPDSVPPSEVMVKSPPASGAQIFCLSDDSSCSKKQKFVRCTSSNTNSSAQSPTPKSDDDHAPSLFSSINVV